MAVVVNVTLLPTLVLAPASDGPALMDGAALKFQPVLLLTLVELVPGLKVAPPVAVESRTER